MRILSLETSSTAGSVAAWTEVSPPIVTVLPPDQRSAQSLAPAIAHTLATAGWRPQEIDLIAVTHGPGSFTGLRIGAATAKTLAYATNAHLVGVNTLEVIAAQAPFACTEVWTVIDAHRGQLFLARYRLQEDGPPQPTMDAHVADIDDWLRQYQPHQAVSGPGLARLRKRLPQEAALVDEELWTPRADTVGRLARFHFAQGRRDVIWSFAPRYYRPSAAEEKHAT